ncbi:unnamed protein product [Chrysoparadoxa australica]
MKRHPSPIDEDSRLNFLGSSGSGMRGTLLALQLPSWLSAHAINLEMAESHPSWQQQQRGRVKATRRHLPFQALTHHPVPPHEPQATLRRRNDFSSND